MTTPRRHALPRLLTRLMHPHKRVSNEPAKVVSDKDVRGIPPCSLHFEESGIRIHYVPRQKPPGDA